MEPTRRDTAATGPLGRDPIALSEQRLKWIDQRQAVLSQNVANADTPHYRARDITPFADLLASKGGPALARTNARHLQPPGAGSGPARVRAERRAVEETPDGNAVSLEEQAMKVADTETAHQLATGLRRSWLGMFKTALGR